MCCRSLGNGLVNGGIVARFSADVLNFCPLQTIHIVSGSYLAPYSIGAEGFLPAVKRPEREAYH